MTEMFICENILTISGYRNQIYFQKPYTDGDTLLSVV